MSTKRGKFGAVSGKTPKGIHQSLHDSPSLDVVTDREERASPHGFEKKSPAKET
jgi:hypothetical protein